MQVADSNLLKKIKSLHQSKSTHDGITNNTRSSREMSDVSSDDDDQDNKK